MAKRDKKIARRSHFVLFKTDTPFKPKVEQSKVKYKRQPKHRGGKDD